MMKPRTVYLVRHAQSTGNQERRVQGQLDTPLSEAGLVQARCLGDRFAKVELGAVYSSPLRRCGVVAELVAKERGLRVTYLDGLKERAYGSWQGLTREEIEARHPGHWHGQGPFDRPEGGESAVELWDRAQRAWHHILSEGSEPALVVSHIGIIAVLLGALEGRPRETALWAYGYPIGNTSVCVFRGGRLECIGDNSHLEGLTDAG